MRFLKALGLAAIAAAALTAIMGAGTASAYTLCAQGSETTANGQVACLTGSPTHYPKGEVFKATAKEAVLTVTGNNRAFNRLDCHSEVTVEQTGTGSDDDVAVPGTVKSLKFTSCTSTEPDLGTCTVTEGTGYTGSIVGTTGGNGTLTVTSTTSTKVTCGGFFSCTYTTAKNGVQMTVTAGNPGKFDASEVFLTLAKGGIGCGEGAKWDATYELLGPTNLAIGTEDK